MKCEHLGHHPMSLHLDQRIARTKVYVAKDVIQLHAASEKKCKHGCGMCTSS